MWSSLALRTSRLVAANPSVRSTVWNGAQVAVRAAPRFFSGEPFAVDAPDGEHDLQDIVSLFACYLPLIQTNKSWSAFSNFMYWCTIQPKQEESSSWAKRTIDVASVTEDADAITEMHHAVLGKQMFAVDGPDGEHDLEDVVSSKLHPCFVLWL